jgi:hypothetical protein
MQLGSSTRPVLHEVHYMDTGTARGSTHHNFRLGGDRTEGRYRVDAIHGEGPNQALPRWVIGPHVNLNRRLQMILGTVLVIPSRRPDDNGHSDSTWARLKFLSGCLNCLS